MFSMSSTQRFTTSTPEPLAMTFYEMTRPAPQKLSITDKIFDAMFERLIAGTKKVQYSKMIAALSTITDEQLSKIGVARKDIPAHARACIYRS